MRERKGRESEGETIERERIGRERGIAAWTGSPPPDTRNESTIIMGKKKLKNK